MARKKATVSSSEQRRKLRPAMTPEARENQMISLAMDAAEEQLINGTASSQVITHFLKLATVKEQLELEKLKAETEMAKAKTEALQSAKTMEEMFSKAMDAIKSYRGLGDEEEMDDFDAEIL